jgi:iron complex outermembrane recepter protein
MKKFILVLLAGCYTVLLNAQTPDSARVLQQVIVKAYEQNRQLKEVSAAINYVDKPQLDRYNNTSILPALNATPGVRMEERSPGSYRLNIRGSTLRSPFGVRNVKVYWNGIPFTDPGGNTYLNQLSYYNIGTIEVIKGPAGSLYGAGTGGALLINSQEDDWSPGASLSYGMGSYNLQNLSAQVRLGSDERRNSFGYTHQTSDGYRDHTNMRRDVATWETRIQASEKQELQASVLYGDLYYQTPGGLTEAQYLANPRAARGPAGMFPGADQAKAAIYQKTFLAGLNHTYRFSEHFQNSSVAYGAFSQIKNPTFRNYEKRSEPHFGGRTVFSWRQENDGIEYGILFGGEAQKGFFNTKTFVNDQGNPAAVQTDDDIDTWIYSAFAQIDLQLRGGWSVSAGSSFNKSSITIQRLSTPLFEPVKRSFKSEFAPRLAISKKIIPGLLLYASVAEGFSPPTTQEVLPSTTVISTDLEAERGINYEGGLKSTWLNQRLYVEVNAFHFRLKNAIVQRRDTSGADYFDNAGSTRQEGIESQAYYQLLPRSGRFVSNAKLWASHTLSRFRYHDFKQVNNDFSKNRIPSVARNTVAAGVDIITRPGIYANITYYYSDPIPLNDANTAFASSYNLLGGRIGFRKALSKKIIADIFAGVDNAFDVQYSLGNDINAAGGRYYNAAAGVNYFAGVAFQFNAQGK